MMSMAEFGKYIYCKRKEKGFTQETFASLLGITPQAVSKWENGIGYPDITLFQEIARVLGVSIDDLFGNKSAGVIEDSPDTLNGLAKIAVFGNRTCYSDKTVSDISGNTVNFSDGSKADLLDGSVLNIGKGEVCFFEAEPSAKQYEESGPTEFEKVFEHFSGISSTLNGAYDLEILSSKDGVFKVMADGSSNFIGSLEMRVVNDIFVLSNKVERANFRGRNFVRIYVGFDIGSELELTINGSGSCTVSPNFKKTKLTVNGSGVVKAKNSGSVAAVINGSGDINLDTCDDVCIEVNGSGDIDVKSCSDSKIRIRGSGDVNVEKVSGDSDVAIHGSGGVCLSGVLEKFICRVDGSGDIDGSGLTVREADIRADGEGGIVLGRIVERSYEKLSKNAKLKVGQRG